MRGDDADALPPEQLAAAQQGKVRTDDRSGGLVPFLGSQPARAARVQQQQQRHWALDP